MSNDFDQIKKLLKNSTWGEEVFQDSISNNEAGWVRHIREGQDEVQKLTAILNGLRNDVNCAKSLLEKERSNHYMTQQRLKSACDCVEGMKSEIGNKDCYISKLQSALTNMSGQVVQQKQRLEQLETCIGQWQEEAAKLKTALTKTLTEQSQCEEESCRKTEEIKRLNLDLNRLKCENEIHKHETISKKKALEAELTRVNYEFCRAKEELLKIKQCRSSIHQIMSSTVNSNNDETYRMKSDLSELQRRLADKEKEMHAINCYNKQLEDLIKEKNTQLLNNANTMEKMERDIIAAKNQITCLNERNTHLESCNEQESQEVRRLQMMICELQKKQQDQDLSSTSAWEDSQTQRCLEAQRKLTYTLVHQLNDAQTKIYSLIVDKSNLEKLIKEVKTVNSCLTEELKQIKDTKLLYLKDTQGGDCNRLSNYKLGSKSRKMIASCNRVCSSVREQEMNTFRFGKYNLSDRFKDYEENDCCSTSSN